MSRDDGQTWSTPVAVDNVGLASTGALQRIHWVSFTQPADRYLDNTARFFVGYYRVGEPEGKAYKNRLRWVRVQVGPRADFNGDEIVDDSDLIDFEAAHAASTGAPISTMTASLTNWIGVRLRLPWPATILGLPDDPGDPGEGGPSFQQAADGLVSIEAEHFAAQPAGWSLVARSACRIRS